MLFRSNSAYPSLGICSDDGTANIDYFPKADPSTYPAPTNGSNPPDFGTLDLRPYSSDFTNGAIRTVNAKSGSKIFWDTTANPAQFTGGTAQVPGSRFEMALTTSQAASLYGLPTAALVPGGSGPDDPAVTATSEAMAKQLTAAKATGVDGVTAPDPGAYVDGGYPMTMQTYAAINVCQASLPQLTDYEIGRAHV